MSQRQGAPETPLSTFCLRVVSWLFCKDTPNEWQMVWDQREDHHHQSAPHSQGRYSGHTCNTCRWDLETHPLQPTVVYTVH